MRGFIFSLSLVAVLLSGCKTTEEPRVETALDPIAVRKFAKNFEDPRFHALSLYRSRTGEELIADGFRLHRGQKTMIPFAVEKDQPIVPVLELDIIAGNSAPALVDISSAECWADIDGHNELKLTTLGYQNVMQYSGRRDLGKASTAYRSVCNQLRLKDNMFVENALFYTRMSVGGLGPMARGVDAASPKVVVGWDLLSKFHIVQLDLTSGFLMLDVEGEYELDEYKLLGTASLIKAPEYGCIVKGFVNGIPQMFVLDPLGDFAVAWPDRAGSNLNSVKLGDLELANLNVSSAKIHNNLPHIGRHVLSKYTLTVCPNDQIVYFEQPTILEK